VGRCLLFAVHHGHVGARLNLPSACLIIAV
jgi:hypothetical protein